MTRVNLVHPSMLADQHLIAEYRELPMVPAALRRSLRTIPEHVVLKSIPLAYSLGAGHVKFFYNKLLFIKDRYDLVCEEMDRRCFNRDLNRKIDIETDIPISFRVMAWYPNQHAIEKNKQRLAESLEQKPYFYRYFGEYGMSNFIASEMRESFV